MSMFFAQAPRGFALGAKYGVLDGFRRFNETTETPKMDETAMQGAIGIIIAVGGVLIALYIIAVVVGSISYAVTSGNIKLSPTWNTTITKEINGILKVFYISVYIDSQAQATFNLAKSYLSLSPKSRQDFDLKRFLGGECASDCNYWGRYPDDRYRCILRPRHLSRERGRLKVTSPELTIEKRTLNKTTGQWGKNPTSLL